MALQDFAEPPDRPRKTELQKMHEQVERALRPLRQMEEMQEQLKRLSPGYEMQDLLRQMQPERALQESLARAIPENIQDIIDGSSVARQAQRMMDQHFPRNTLANLGLDSEMLRRAAGLTMDTEALRRAAGLDSISDIAKQYERYLKPVWEHQQLVERMHRDIAGAFSAKAIAQQLEQTNPAFRAIEEAKRSLDRIWGQFRDIDVSQFEADDDQEQEAARAAEDITKTATAEPSLKEAVDAIVQAIEAQRNPGVKLLLWLYFKKVIEILISGAVGAVMGVYITPLLTPTASPQAETKLVREVARQVVGAPELLAEYRYVSAKVLVVRQNPRALSPELARLKFGKPVKLLKKQTDFALVVWSDKESGAEIQGWVFARHLAKFK